MIDSIHVWRKRYHDWPNGDEKSIRRHRRIVQAEAIQRAARKLNINLWWA